MKGKARFERMEQARAWKAVFFDAGIGDARTGRWQDGLWQKKWFLDGEIANVDNEKMGMHLHAGPRWKANDHHMVLWTHQEFTGDLKIEYEFTRTDMEGPKKTSYFYFKNDKFPPVTHGRIGLRHMYTRSAWYKNFRVSESLQKVD